MEKGTSNNKGLVIILLLIVLGLVGYIAYDKVLSKEKLTNEENITNSKNQLEESDTNQAEENNTTLRNDVGQVLNSIYGTFIIDKDGSVYFKPNEKVVTAGYEATFKKDTSLGTTNKYTLEAYASGPSEHIFEGYKLDVTNTVSAYEVYRGNGGNKYVLFIDKIGDVYQVNFDIKDGVIDYANIEKLSMYHNIVSVVETHSFQAYSAVLIDKNNKQYQY